MTTSSPRSACTRAPTPCLTLPYTSCRALLAASPLVWSLYYVCHAVNSPLLSFEERERDAAALKMIARDRAGCSKKPSVKSLKLRDLAPVNVKFRASGGAPQAGEAMKVV